MIGLIMAGGKGTRMNLDNEKLLLKYKKPVILHVVDSLNDSKCFSQIMHLSMIPNSFMNFPLSSHCKHLTIIQNNSHIVCH